MVKLSIIIVNYNVKYFLEQCLFSVLKATEKITAEIIVVDNHSVDGSSDLVKEKFPQVRLIENKANVGFSVANNQAILQSKGEYVLLLNPDTVVQEDTFAKIVSFMDSHPNAGTLGVKMLDGHGNFAPESKRGLPTPKVAFYKMIGLAKLFPKSKKFGKYHLTYLPEDQINEIDVVSGAFMFLRKSVLDKVGLLDEIFFMYGEDIDLSYRITQTGFKNYYFPETQIIHYKGESTKKNSLNYVSTFYKSMVIFSKKHFSGSYTSGFNAFIHIAIYLKAFLALCSRFVKFVTIPAVDFGLSVMGLFMIKTIYLKNYGLDNHTYSEKLVSYAFSLYAFIWVLMIYFNEGYEKPIKLLRIVRGVVLGTFFILIGYALLPESLRFSRAFILYGTFWSLSCFVLLRLALHFLKIKSFGLTISKSKRMIIIGEEEEFVRINHLLKVIGIHPAFIGFVNVKINDKKNQYDVGVITQLNEIISTNKINEIIFCAKNVSIQDMIHHMHTLTSVNIDFKIAPPESVSIIGSNDIETSGDLYMVDLNGISKSKNKRNKRLLDIGISLLLLVLIPFLIFIQENKIQFLLNIFKVIIGVYTWVGYGKGKAINLPFIKPSVLSVASFYNKPISDVNVEAINLRYAKDYMIEKDILIILKSLKKLGSN